MIAIKDMEMPKNCVECNHMDLQQAINCQLIYSGCANCGRHPNCPLVEIGTCKDCHNAVKNYGNGRIYCLFSNCIYDEDFWCKKFEKRGNDNGSN